MAGAVAFIRYAKNVFAQVEITARVGSGGWRIVKVVSVVGVNCVARQAGRQPGRHVASLANSLSTRLQAKRVSQPINVFTSLPSPLACRLCVHNLSLPLARPAIEVARREHTLVSPLLLFVLLLVAVVVVVAASYNYYFHMSMWPHYAYAT